MYVVGNLGVDINEYNLSTAWDISTASYLQNFSVSSQETGPTDVTFKTDGTKMYICGIAGDEINEYNLSTAWDISTASASQVFSVSAQDGNPRSLFFKSDGTKLFLSGIDNDSVYLYNLSTAWDISTASYDTSFSVTSQDTLPTGIYIKPDGTKMYVTGYVSDAVYQYSTVLNTASLDLSTGAVFDYTPTSDVQVTVSNPAASGTVSAATLLLTGAGTTSYDLSAASYDSISLDVSSENSDPRSIRFNNDGTKLYMVGSGATGAASDSVFQYSLSTAFDLSTASYDSVSFSVASQDGTPLAIEFNNDGTKMYIVGYDNRVIFQYSLSTAFDLSTASYASISFNPSSQDTIPAEVLFNSNGTKMYILGAANDTIYQYSLSTAYNVSTASYDSVSFSVTSQDNSPQGMVFNNDGTKLFYSGITNDTIYQYSLSTAFDLSTISYDSVSFSVASQDSNPIGITFNNDGTKLYVDGFVTRSIYQYSVASPATITYDTTLEWAGGTAPTSPAIGETDVITVSTRDGGTTYQAIQAIDGAK
jgi:sugar lactone lactonase YvrE